MGKPRILIVVYGVLVLCRAVGGQENPGDRQYGESSVAFAPDSKWVATGGGDAKVRIRDIPNGRLRATLVGHEKLVTAVAVSPDGKTIASGSNDGSIRLWDVQSQTQRQVWRVPETEFFWGIALAYAPDGQTLAAGSADGRLRLWDVAGGKIKASWNASLDWVDVVVFSPDGRTISTTGHDKIVRLWDVQTRALRFELAPLEDRSVRLAYSRDGSLLAVTNKRFILLLDAETGKESSRLADCPIGSHGLAFTKDDAFLVVGSVGDVYLISTGVVVDQDKPILIRKSHNIYLNALAISPDAKRIALCYMHWEDTGHASFEMMLCPPNKLLGVDEPVRN